MNKMNPKIKTIWLEALRSGKYPQIQKRLHSEKGFCCLGVLCDLAVAEGITTRNTEEPGRWNEKGFNYEGHDIFLPLNVMKWADLSVYSCNFVAGRNDQGASFSEIADYIKKNY
jgi:hypothetical protein